MVAKKQKKSMVASQKNHELKQLLQRSVFYIRVSGKITLETLNTFAKVKSVLTKFTQRQSCTSQTPVKKRQDTEIPKKTKRRRRI